MPNKICSVGGCDKPAKTRGLCSGHYHRLSRYGEPTYEPRRHRKIKKCRINGCERDSMALGLCSMHYQRKYRDRTRKRVRAEYGIYKSRPYEAQSFISMRSRCSSPSNISYTRYGGSGIRICKRWSGVNGFSNFLEDMGERPKNTTLDRIDNNEGYSPENCRWSDAKSQSRNRKTNIFYTYNGETLVLADWAIKNGLNPGAVYARWHKGERGKKLFRPSQKK